MRVPRFASEAGTTLIEVTLAMAVLTVGALGAAGVFTSGMQKTTSSPGDLIATQKAQEAIESVFAARDSHKLTWAQIRNVHGESGSDDGIFLDGEQQLKDPGADGLVNTVDDGEIEEVRYPGQDRIMRTGDDTFTTLGTVPARDQDHPGCRRPAGDHRDHDVHSRRSASEVRADHVHFKPFVRQMIMRTALHEDGFTLTELLFSTAITLVVLGTAMGTFQNALMLNETATLIADSNQNLRAGTNELVRDLMQAGRAIPTGGISIPSGAGSTPINRPSPPAQAYQFDNVLNTTLLGDHHGRGTRPRPAGEATDMITMLSVDPRSYVTYLAGAIPDDLVLNANPLGPVGTFPVGLQNPAPTLSANGRCITITAQFATWITDPVDGIRPGHLLMFKAVSGATTIQTVTAISPTHGHPPPANPIDWFNFNQPGAARLDPRAARSAARRHVHLRPDHRDARADADLLRGRDVASTRLAWCAARTTSPHRRWPASSRTSSSPTTSWTASSIRWRSSRCLTRR